MSHLAFTSATAAGGGGPSVINVALSFPSASGTRTGFGTITTRETVTATITGGTPPYSGSWQYNDGSADIYATSSNLLSTKFAAFAELLPIQFTGTWKYVVTDSASNTGESAPLFISLNASMGELAEYVP